MSAKHSKASRCRNHRILLVDDQPLLREGIGHCLKREQGLEVCGVAEGFEEALGAVGRLKPDLVVTDLVLPGRGGLELIKELKGRHPQLPVLVLSRQDERLYASRSLRAGARGYVMEQAGSQCLVESIRTVLTGGIAVSDPMRAQLLEEYSRRPRRSGRTQLPQLTERQFEVFLLLGEARTNSEIARELRLSPKTVETHRLSLMEKLKIRNAADLVRLALQYAGR